MKEKYTTNEIRQMIINQNYQSQGYIVLDDYIEPKILDTNIELLMTKGSIKSISSETYRETIRFRQTINIDYEIESRFVIKLEANVVRAHSILYTHPITFISEGEFIGLNYIIEINKVDIVDLFW